MICRQLMLEDHTKWEHSRAYASRTLSALSGPERIGKSAHGLQGSPRWQMATSPWRFAVTTLLVCRLSREHRRKKTVAIKCIGTWQDNNSLQPKLKTFYFK
ncbi:uncharacterized protein si:ch73-234b20.5 isoform X3 [Tachysurus fulvidraco]|uniref:uncharacterized protein si:ch73-234b20.5 isoform X3 n=1 Tax=Tachysurus fulvidraco TaxID=1234273 RepID=UPI001FEFED68|nr:uncharacterized protein si:ch73-234b20.5 isoform X3 [Tachysurus fulvidraco]